MFLHRQRTHESVATSDREGTESFLWVRENSERSTPPRFRVCRGEEKGVGGHMDGPGFLRACGGFLIVTELKGGHTYMYSNRGRHGPGVDNPAAFPRGDACPRHIPYEY